MKFTLGWLKDYLITDAPLAAITDGLTSLGLEVEEVHDPARALTGFIVATIETAEPHPNADTLRLCQVYDGAARRQIVCGAPNARAGITVVLATEGAIVPKNGMVIRKTSIRGVESNGMLCSYDELGLAGDAAGIIELPEEAGPGDEAASWLGSDDPVITVNVTPNRADCLGVYGIARDLAARGLGTLAPLPALPGPAPATPFTATSGRGVRVETRGCTHFIGVTLRGVKNRPSPSWLARRLQAIGLRPISALVDITNYMTHSFARPLHAYDETRLRGGVTVREAQGGERFAALNGVTYSLAPGMIVITDESGVVGLAGVMGGAGTACDAATQDIFLECALFDAVSVARAGRALGLVSDARTRFERGLDPAFTAIGAHLAAQLILQCCGGGITEWVEVGAPTAPTAAIAFDPALIARLSGLTLPPAEVEALLRRLGCDMQGRDVTPPSWRSDLRCPADLVEEVLRVAGYDRIASVALPPAPVAALPASVVRAGYQRALLARRGMTELCSWAFLPRAWAERFGGAMPALALANPLSPELAQMRPNLLPYLLAAARAASYRQQPDVAVFESGHVFHDVTPEGQAWHLAGLRTGRQVERQPLAAARAVDLFDAKADLFALLAAAGLQPGKLACDRKTPSWYHPARSGRISLGGKVTLGFFGELHPDVIALFDLDGAIVAWEGFPAAWPLAKAKPPARPPLQASNYPAVERDFAFLAEAHLEATQIVKAFEQVEKQLIHQVRLFDVYQGKNLPEGKKSIALSVTLQAPDRTLAEQETQRIVSALLAAAATLGLQLR